VQDVFGAVLARVAVSAGLVEWAVVVSGDAGVLGLRGVVSLGEVVRGH